MRCFVIFLCSLLLVGCSNLSFDGLASGGSAAAVSAGTTALTGNPLIGITAGSATAVAVDAAIPDPVTTATNFCQANPQECDKFIFIQFLEKIWKWLVGGVFGLVVMAWLIPGPQSLFFWRKQ